MSAEETKDQVSPLHLEEGIVSQGSIEQSEPIRPSRKDSSERRRQTDLNPVLQDSKRDTAISMDKSTGVPDNVLSPTKTTQTTPLKNHGRHDEDGDVAIQLSSAYKHYGSGKNKTPVLVGLDMEVTKGQIYGLLGPSGCGKTTLLKCIVGKLKLDEGSIVVFGKPPGLGSGTEVPGSRVGYMPQEMALFGEFNISETLIYFARVFGMSPVKYKERVEFLMKFLDLPSKTRALQNMSGGQQRRASLAVALLHEPELLILDEPTVGVDPLLRQSIWSHLVDISSNGRTTIVITTHYIEEARQADRVGMMRFGKLLAEGHPEDLLRRCALSKPLSHKGPTLEDVFLELCLRDGDLETPEVRVERSSRTPIIKKSKTVSIQPNEISDEKLNNNKRKSHLKSNKDGNSEEEMVTLPLNQEKNLKTQFVSAQSQQNSRFKPVSKYLPLPRTPRPRWGKVKACMLKTFTRMKRRWGFLIYQFMLPALQVSLFCLAIGQDPKELPVAIVNYENQGMACHDQMYNLECPITFENLGIPEPNEHLVNFTCRYLSFLDSSVATPIFYPSEALALKAVEDGHAWGLVSMDHNFTKSLYSRIIDSATSGDIHTVNKELFNSSTIKVRLDVTNQHIAFSLQLKLVEAFQKFTDQLIHSCNLPTELASIPLTFDDPVYGSHQLTFTDFMAPGIILTIVHSMALGYSAMIIIMERNEGMLDRTWVAGVTPGEFALAHFLVSLVVNLLQVIITLVFMILVFKVPAEGSLIWIFLLTMLQGIAGTTIGLIISAVCQTQQDATQIALGIFYPNLILSGIIWPVESMPIGLRYFSYVLPQTFACEAMRGILLRGWGLLYMPVWRGFVVTIAWIIATYAIFKKLVGREN